MAKKKDDSKIGGVKSTRGTRQVESTESISTVDKVKATKAVSGVRGSGAVGKDKPTRAMTIGEREEIFRLIDEEAEKLFKESGLPAEKKKMVKEAVKMAVDAGLVEEEDKKEK